MLTIAIDFGRPKKFKIDRGKNVYGIQLYLFTIWFVQMSLIDFVRRIKRNAEIAALNNNKKERLN